MIEQFIITFGFFALFLFAGFFSTVDWRFRRVIRLKQCWSRCHDKILPMKKLLFALLVSALALTAQSRTVTLSWTASTSSGVTGYIVSTSTSATGTFTAIGCTGTVPNGAVPSSVTCATGSTSSTTTFTDPAETIGNTVYYELQAAAAACPSNTTSTPTGSATIACGVGSPTSVVGVVIQPRATAPATLTIILI